MYDKIHGLTLPNDGLMSEGTMASLSTEFRERSIWLQHGSYY